MAQKCTVCAHAGVGKINKQIVDGVPFDTLAKANGLTVSALQRHNKGHFPAQLAKAKKAKEAAAADSLMDRVAALNSKAEDVYSKALKADNLIAAIGAIRELRGITELYAKITGELQAQAVTNIVIMPEWMSLRNVILVALEPYPDARRAVVEAVGRVEIAS